MNELSNNNDLPCVGIFWFDVDTLNLFGVCRISVDKIDSNLMTINKLHKDVWSKNYLDAMSLGHINSKYFIDYTKVPRGRVWYNRNKDKFWVTVGHWVSECEGVLRNLIESEFKIDNFEFDINENWDLGRKWAENDVSDLMRTF